MKNAFVKTLASALCSALAFFSPTSWASHDFAGHYSIELANHQKRSLLIAADRKGQWLYNDHPHNHQSELWQKNPQGQLTLLRVFHDLKFSLFYTPSDIPSAAIDNDPLLSTLLNGCNNTESIQQGVAEQFTTPSLKCQRGALTLIWLPEKGLPLSVEGPDFKISLIQLEPFDFGEKQVELDQYEEMDFIDIGDNESHPALKKLGHATINLFATQHSY